MPLKLTKFGIKFSMLCDATTYYVLRAFSYVGKEAHQVSTGRGKFITLSLLEPYRKTDLNMTCDNSFTSLSLAKNILQQNTVLVGSIRRHRKIIPKTIRFGKDAVFIRLCFSSRGHWRRSSCWAIKQRKTRLYFYLHLNTKQKKFMKERKESQEQFWITTTAKVELPP